MAHAGTMSGQGYVAQRDAVVAFLVKNPKVAFTRAEVAERVGVSPSRAGDILRELSDQATIERERRGHGHGYLYRAIR